jgi:predicted dehydrogenase
MSVRDTPPVRWGILGTGGMARVFTEDLLRCPGHRVNAVGSRAPGPASAFARAYGIEQAYGSYRELASDENLDIVYVATPQSHHLATARLCIEAGRAVLVEKPFAMTAAQARDLVGEARQAGVFAVEAMWMRFNPVVREAVRLVREGAIASPSAAGSAPGSGRRASAFTGS